MKLSFIIIFISICFYSSAVAQTTADWNIDGVYYFNPESENVSHNQNSASDFILLEKYPYIIGKKNDKNTDEVKLWNLKNGSSESIYKVSEQADKEDTERVLIKRVMATHDESKIIIYIRYFTPLDWQKYGQTNRWGETVYTGNVIPKTFRLVCYSLLDQKIIWQTERIKESEYMSIMDLSNIGVSNDDIYIYYWR